DVSHNSLYGRLSLDFKGMVPDAHALINLAHNFFSGDALLFAAGTRVCPMEASGSSNPSSPSTFDAFAGKCKITTFGLQDYSVTWAGKEVRGSVAGNCLTLTPDTECSFNATQRSSEACRAFCGITANGPCDGHGVCVLPAAPSSPSNFTCRCDAGYSALDSGSGSTCALLVQAGSPGSPGSPGSTGSPGSPGSLPKAATATVPLLTPWLWPAFLALLCCVM
ncbi:unnamed protein product, partial [Closterium sp. Naga37s-1]